MSARMIGSANDSFGVDGFSFPEGMRDEHNRFLVQWEIINSRTGGLNSKVVLVFNVDRTISLFCDFNVVGCTFKAFISEAFINDSSIRMKNGMHVSRVRVVIIGIDKCGEDGVGEPSALLVDVADGIGGACKYDTINVQCIVEFIMDSFLSVG